MLKYEAREFVPGEIAKRQAMYLWRGANMQAQRKTCEDACKDVRSYIYSLGDEYQSVYFSCSYMEDGNNETVKDHMIKLTNPTGTACGNDNECTHLLCSPSLLCTSHRMCTVLYFYLYYSYFVQTRSRRATTSRLRSR